MSADHMDQSGGRYPARLDIDYPEEGLNRVTTLFRIIMLIPIGIVISLLSSGYGNVYQIGDATWIVVSSGGFLFGPTLLMLLFRRKYPRWWFDWNLELMRFSTRVGAYFLLMRDEYPSTDEEQAVHLELDYPDAEQRPEPLAAAGEVAARDPALHRAHHPRGHRDGAAGGGVVRDPVHGAIPARDLPLHAGREPLVAARGGLHVAAHHRPLPLVQLRGVASAPDLIPSPPPGGEGKGEGARGGAVVWGAVCYGVGRGSHPRPSWREVPAPNSLTPALSLGERGSDADFPLRSVSAKLAPMPVEDATLERIALSRAEYERLVAMLDREPNELELGMAAALWSEHCGYKHTRPLFHHFPTTGPRVLTEAGAENAGAIDLGDGWCAVFKMESHNHPSAIEPYEGAATGVGGILRDIFAMGMRPVALLDSLRFGPLDEARNRHLFSGVVAGIGGYGNCVGVPTVGGEVQFDPAYGGNPLVNAMCLGVGRIEHMLSASARGPGNPLVLVGADTGRDGIHGATFASVELDDASAERRPAVQVGNPFMEKLLLEACVELAEQHGDWVEGLQDLGAAGLTSSAIEAAARAGTGIEIDVARVPRREAHMTPDEVMLSESQERMLVIPKRAHLDDVLELFRRWELHADVVGEVTDDGYATIRDGATIAARIPSPCSPTRRSTSSRPSARRTSTAARRRTSPRCRTARTRRPSCSRCSAPRTSPAAAGSTASTTTRCSPARSCRRAATPR